MAGGPTTLALISDARPALAAALTLPDIRKVMEAASVAANAGRRAAKLAEAHGLAADVVRDAEAAAREAAAVRIEAQAKAGELLKEMAERERGTREAVIKLSRVLRLNSATSVYPRPSRAAGSRSPQSGPTRAGSTSKRRRRPVTR
jgi:hypothetical protein